MCMSCVFYGAEELSGMFCAMVKFVCVLSCMCGLILLRIPSVFLLFGAELHFQLAMSIISVAWMMPFTSKHKYH